ncbi:hypothetical protein KFK09_019868 [Dendrobium nobile]|uniref:RRM domain-containing protein n=1 Tax=Dendrobium nobile TaxID=94219 RepID=A0A8T3ARN6_DENNO|nr:hypothetical protein KFK09_019868 [Dendrobium nobile]
MHQYQNLSPFRRRKAEIFLPPFVLSNVMLYIFHTPLVKPHLSNCSQVEIPRHEESKHSKGYAFIQYCSQEDAILAVEEIDRKWINGRLVYAEIAKPLHGIAYPKTSGPPLQQSSVSNESRK